MIRPLRIRSLGRGVVVPISKHLGGVPRSYRDLSDRSGVYGQSCFINNSDFSARIIEFRVSREDLVEERGRLAVCLTTHRDSQGVDPLRVSSQRLVRNAPKTAPTRADTNAVRTTVPPRTVLTPDLSALGLFHHFAVWAGLTVGESAFAYPVRSFEAGVLG